MDRRILDEVSPVNLGVVDSLAHGPALEALDELKRKGEFVMQKERGLDMKLGGEHLLRNGESAELAHPPVIVDHGAEGSDVSWEGEPGSLGWLVIVENISSVLGSYKARDFKDPLVLRKRVRDRNLDYTLTVGDLSEQRAFVKAWRRELQRGLIANWEREDQLKK